MNNLRHDLQMILLVAVAIVVFVIGAIFISFLLAQSMGSQDLYYMRQHVPVAHSQIYTHDFNEGGLGWRN